MERESAIRLLRALVAAGLRHSSRWQMSLSVMLPFRPDWTNSMRLGDTQANRAGWLRPVLEDAYLGRLKGRKGGISALQALPASWIGPERDLRADFQVRVRTKGADLICTPCS